MTYQYRKTGPLPVEVPVTQPIGDGQIINKLLGPDAVTGDKVKDGEIKSEDIGTGQIKTEDIATAAVTAVKLGADVVVGTVGVGGITEAKIADGAVTLVKMAPDSIDSTKIKTSAVGADEIAPGAVINTKVGAQAISNDKITDDTILPGKLSQSAAIVAEEAIVKDTVTGKFKSLPFPSAGAQLKVGSYTGNGAATKAITGVGFQPKAVMIFQQIDSASFAQPYFKTNQDGLNAYTFDDVGSVNAWQADIIISLDADGFTVGQSWEINTNLQSYAYVALG